MVDWHDFFLRGKSEFESRISINVLLSAICESAENDYPVLKPDNTLMLIRDIEQFD